MANKYLEKLAEYTDKEHARKTLSTGLLSKEYRKRETLGGMYRTGTRATAEGIGGGLVGTVAGAGIGKGIAHLAGNKSGIGAIAGGVAGYAAGAAGGMYHGALASVRNRIREGKLKDTKDTSKK